MSPMLRKILQPLPLSVAAIAYAYLQVRQPFLHLHCNDFKHIYLGIQAVWSGRDPYSAPSLLALAQEHGLGNAALNPYVYLPFTALALGFLRPLSFPAAAMLWFALNHVLLWCALGAMAEVFARVFPGRLQRRDWFALLLGAASVSHPLTRTLTAGQLNLVLLFCYACGALLLWKGRESLAGALLGFAAMFKIAPVIFLLHWVLVRRWRALSAMILVMLSLAIVSLAIAGLRPHLDFLPVFRQMGYGRSTWQEYGATFWKDPWNQSLNALLTHLLVEANRVTRPWIESSQEVANFLTWLGAFAFLLAYFVVAQLGRPMRLHNDEDLRARLADLTLYHAAVVLALLLPSLLWDHYLVQLILPCGWLLALGVHRGWRWLGAAACICYAITAVAWPFDSDTFRRGLGVALMSGKLYPTIAVYALLLWAARALQKSCIEQPGLQATDSSSPASSSVRTF